MSEDLMFNRIETFPNKFCGNGVSDAEIAAAEESLGIMFSKSYREFLRRYGWGQFAHCEIYGLGPDVPTHLDLFRNTLAERAEMVPALPSHLIPIMNDGSGSHFCLDTSALRDDECPVVLWDHEQTELQIPETAAPTFSQFIVGLLSELCS